MNLSKCKLELSFEFSKVNLACMSVMIKIADHISMLHPQTQGFHVFEHDIELPTIMNLTFAGKNEDLDTVVDSDGKIIIDKHVVLHEIKLDKFVVDTSYLQKHLELHTATQKIYSNYVGFNGEMSINLDRSNVFFQIQSLANIGKNVDRPKNVTF